MESHPLRVRGLKPWRRQDACGSVRVASFTGAWIETEVVQEAVSDEVVASFTGAWIETKPHCKHSNLFASHPLRVRGLKLYVQELY